ncbi:MAG: replication/maintenance protein RepL [Alphaproteobacteria bacterium]|nr:replication/maintenance protein RepL [Alphaproteobacteria bacterium]
MVVATERQRKIRENDLKHEEEAAEKAQEDRQKSPYKKWTQVNNSREAYEAEDWLMANSPSAYRILRLLVSNMDRYNAVICSYKVIQEKLRFSEATVKRAIRLLKEHKYIDVKKTGTSNVYMVNKMLYWNSWGNKYAYAEFGAKVIISSSEQDDETKEEIKLQIKRRTEIEIKTKKTDQAGQTELVLTNEAG